MTGSTTQRERIVALEQQLVVAQKMEAVGRFAACTAHDFANLLIPIMTYSEAVARSLPSNSNLQAHLQEIRKAAERAAELAQRLLAISCRETT